MECVPLKKKWKKLSLWDKIRIKQISGFHLWVYYCLKFANYTVSSLKKNHACLKLYFWLHTELKSKSGSHCCNSGPTEHICPFWLQILWPSTQWFVLGYVTAAVHSVCLLLVTIFPLVIPTALLFTSWSHFPLFSLPHCMSPLHGPTGGKDRRNVCGLHQHHALTNAGLLLPMPVRCAAARDVLGWQRDNVSATNMNRAVLFPYLQVCVCLEGRRSE